MKILQLNMHRSRVADALLPQIMMEESADIAIISEQYGSKSGLWVEDETGTAAIWAPVTGGFRVIRSGRGSCFAWLQSQEVTLVSCYLSPSDNIETFEGKINKIEDFIRTIRGHLIVTGDVNARSVDWGMQTTDARGRKIVEMMARSGLMAANVGDCPTFTRPGCVGTIPDVTLAPERTLREIADWKLINTYTGSDHQYISYNFGRSIAVSHETNLQSTTTRKWNAGRLNKEILMSEIEQNYMDLGGTTNASRAAEILVDLIQKACDKAMPRIGTGRRGKRAVHWWNEDIARARRDCIECRRKLTRARRRGEAEIERALYKEAKKRLRVNVFHSKRKSWEKLRDELNSNPWGTGYKLVIGKLSARGQTPVMDEEKMMEIVQALFPEHDGIERELAPVEDTNVPFFTEEELVAAASNLKLGKAPGPDGIPSEVVREIAHKKPEILLSTYNKCLAEGTFPRIWKMQKLVLINKGKGCPDSASAYRPLCMLDTSGKLLERLIKPRLMRAINEAGGLSKRQHGFIPGRSTVDALMDVVSTFETAQQRNHFSRPIILLATLDVKNAFNSLRWKDVFHALETGFCVPSYLSRIIRSYLSNRELIYSTNQGLRSTQISSGAAQGSILGPDLWNITYDDILRIEMPQDTFIVGYADDIAAVISARDTGEAERKLRQVMIRTQAWLESHGLCLATHKTELILLTRRHIQTEIEFRVGEITLRTQRCLNYLGIRLDPKMTYSSQIKHAATKAAKITAQLGRLMANIGGPTEGKRRLLMDTSTSILLYGCEVWGEALKRRKSSNALLAVQRISALRITSAYRTVSGAAVFVIAGVIPVDLMIQERRRIWKMKRQNTFQNGAEVQIRGDTLRAWQRRWSAETKGRWTARLLPDLVTWYRRRAGEVNYYLTQMLSGHGYFRKYLHRMGKCQNPYCLYEKDEHVDDAEHTFFECSRWTQERSELEARTGPITVENITTVMLTNEDNWKAVERFCKKVLCAKKWDLDATE